METSIPMADVDTQKAPQFITELRKTLLTTSICGFMEKQYKEHQQMQPNRKDYSFFPHYISILLPYIPIKDIEKYSWEKLKHLIQIIDWEHRLQDRIKYDRLKYFHAAMGVLVNENTLDKQYYYKWFGNSEKVNFENDEQIFDHFIQQYVTFAEKTRWDSIRNFYSILGSIDLLLEQFDKDPTPEDPRLKLKNFPSLTDPNWQSKLYSLFYEDPEFFMKLFGNKTYKYFKKSASTESI